MPIPTIVTIDSSDDTVTQSGYVLRERFVYQDLSPPRANLVRCQNQNATRPFVADVASRPEVSMLMGVGHGEGDVYTGQGRQPIFQAGQYDSAEVSGRAIHWTACDTAQTLGPDMVRKGAAAFFGYIEEIAFPPELAEIFFDCDAEIDRALVDGASAGEAQRLAILRFNKYIEVISNRDPNSYLIQWLALNRDRLRGPLNDPAFGSPQAQIR